MDNNVAYGLSGERRIAAIRQWKARMVISALLAVAAFVGLLLVPSHAASIVYGAGILVMIIWAFFVFSKRETGWQLWDRERTAIQKRREDNLRDIQQFAEDVRKRGNKNGN